MARNTKTLAHLRNSTSGASLTEYVALLALVGGMAIGAVLGLGVNVQDDFSHTQDRVDEVARIANGGLAPVDNGSGGSGGTGTGGSGGGTPPVDVFASCEAGYGPNPAAIRGNGDGSLLSGGDDGQVFYALANATVDGGEGGADFDTLMVPGAGAVATFTSWSQPESGRVDMPDGGAVLFSNIERVATLFRRRLRPLSKSARQAPLPCPTTPSTWARSRTLIPWKATDRLKTPLLL
jgi:Flp pilus assembly pilin Flp